MKVYQYRVFDEYGSLITENVTSRFGELDLDGIAPGVNTTSDRNLDEVQRFLDMNYPDLHYRFEPKVGYPIGCWMKDWKIVEPYYKEFCND